MLRDVCSMTSQLCDVVGLVSTQQCTGHAVFMSSAHCDVCAVPFDPFDLVCRFCLHDPLTLWCGFQDNLALDYSRPPSSAVTSCT